MEVMKINSDIKVFYVNASSFPMGVKAAHEKLHGMVPAKEGRRYFGLAYPDGKGGLNYKAAVEESYEGEGAKHGCDTLIIPKGDYVGERLFGYMKDISMIGKCFERILADPRTDPKGFGVEEYVSMEEMVCMVPGR